MLLPAAPPLAAPSRRAPTWGTDTLFPEALLFARGRFALVEALRLCRAARGVRRVWLPAYLCWPVVDAVRAAGLAHALYDVDERLEPRRGGIALASGDALLVVHYFGLAVATECLRQRRAGGDVPLIENCAHAVPDPGAGVRLGALGDLAVFSPRKQAPVPGGGLLVVNDRELRRLALRPPDRGLGDRRTALRLGVMLTERLAVGLGVNLLPVKDHLPVLDAGDGDGRREAALAAPPPARLLGALLRRVDWRAQIGARQAGYVRLAERLAGTRGVTLPVPEPPPGSVPQALPVWVDDPDRVVRGLRRRGVEAMRWPHREQIAIDRAAFPGARRWLEHSLLLPLGVELTPRRVDHVASALGAGLDPDQP